MRLAQQTPITALFLAEPKMEGEPLIVMNDEYVDKIVGFPIFNGFTSAGAQMLLEYGEVKEYSPGEVLFSEGDLPTVVLLVLTGKIQVFVERQGHELVLTDVGPGAILGELALLCGIPRSASVRASEKSAALQWSDTAFRQLLLGNLSLSQRIFKESLRTLIEKEKALIDSLTRKQSGEH